MHSKFILCAFLVVLALDHLQVTSMRDVQDYIRKIPARLKIEEEMSGASLKGGLKHKKNVWHLLNYVSMEDLFSPHEFSDLIGDPNKAAIFLENDETRKTLHGRQITSLYLFREFCATVKRFQFSSGGDALHDIYRLAKELESRETESKRHSGIAKFLALNFGAFPTSQGGKVLEYKAFHAARNKAYDAFSKKLQELISLEPLYQDHIKVLQSIKPEMGLEGLREVLEVIKRNERRQRSAYFGKPDAELKFDPVVAFIPLTWNFNFYGVQNIELKSRILEALKKGGNHLKALIPELHNELKHINNADKKWLKIKEDSKEDIDLEELNSPNTYYLDGQKRELSFSNILTKEKIIHYYFRKLEKLQLSAAASPLRGYQSTTSSIASSKGGRTARKPRNERDK